MSYCKEHGGQFYDWVNVLTPLTQAMPDGEAREELRNALYEQAHSWVTCPVGQLPLTIARDYLGVPQDSELRAAGLFFTEVVDQVRFHLAGNWLDRVTFYAKMALSTINRITLRSQALLR